MLYSIRRPYVDAAVLIKPPAHATTHHPKHTYYYVSAEIAFPHHSICLIGQHNIYTHATQWLCVWLLLWPCVLPGATSSLLRERKRHRFCHRHTFFGLWPNILILNGVVVEAYSVQIQTHEQRHFRQSGIFLIDFPIVLQHTMHYCRSVCVFVLCACSYWVRTRARIHPSIFRQNITHTHAPRSGIHTRIMHIR